LVSECSACARDGPPRRIGRTRDGARPTHRRGSAERSRRHRSHL
jgi:hypothetical protein